MRKKTIETLEDATYDLVHNSAIPAKVQAELLGISYSRLINSCIESAETAYHHTRWIIPQTLAARNTVLVDYIERRLGRVAIEVPAVQAPKNPESYRAELMRIAKELGDLAGAVEASLEIDNYLDKDERATARKEAWDIIEQAARFYAMLGE